MYRFIVAMFVLAVWSGLVPSAWAVDVTIDSVTKNKLMGGQYQVVITGTLAQLTDVGGGYERWGALETWVEQPGTKLTTTGIVYLIPPSLTAAGKFQVTVNVMVNPDVANWEAWARATVVLNNDNPPATGTKQAKKAFTLP
jgi:hypothetical protein